ncbi:phage major capsid protein [Bacillus altitudinis]|uniref:phage major capsid protein n=1 Tax=Bacillus altitudinis TaxID=293387 RepID=UPI00272A0628|nr:phage major capsid protein [Bacillus altitudinis]WLF29200.1 phage major capsid protein [Bacillus altitudinis]
MKDKFELRFNDVELTGSDDSLRVSGYVNKTNQWSEPIGTRKKFIEKIEQGAFRKALQNGNEVHFYAEHSPAKILATTRNGSLTLREDEQGLFMSAEIVPTSWGKDYHTLIKTGVIRNMSFGMKVLKDTWKQLSDGTYERSISELLLAEVSAVRNPAYVQSTISARSIDIVDDPQINLSKETENKMFDTKVNDVYRQKLENFDNDSVAVRNNELTEEEKEIRGFEQFLRNEDGAERRAMTTTTGAVMIPTHLHNQVVEKMYEVAPIFRHTRNFKPANGKLEVLAEKDMGKAATFIGEAQPLTPEDFTLSKVTLSAKRGGTAVEISEHTINDSGINIVDYAIKMLSKSLGITVDENILFGKGESFNQFEGILVDVNKIAQKSIASLSGLTMDNLIDFYNSINPQYVSDIEKDAVWVISRKAFNRISKLKINGVPILNRDVVENGTVYKLLGHSVYISEKMDDPTANPNNKLIVFGNFFEGYTTMTQRGIRLRHVTGDTDTTQALRGSELLLLDGYFDGKILQPDALKVMKFTTV